MDAVVKEEGEDRRVGNERVRSDILGVRLGSFIPGMYSSIGSIAAVSVESKADISRKRERRDRITGTEWTAHTSEQ